MGLGIQDAPFAVFSKKKKQKKALCSLCFIKSNEGPTTILWGEVVDVLDSGQGHHDSGQIRVVRPGGDRGTLQLLHEVQEAGQRLGQSLI